MSPALDQAQPVEVGGVGEGVLTVSQLPAGVMAALLHRFEDAEEAPAWLVEYGLFDGAGALTWKPRP